jgi:hypothetical protein
MLSPIPLAFLRVTNNIEFRNPTLYFMAIAFAKRSVIYINLTSSLIPLESRKNESINMGKLVNTELI